MPQLSPLRPRRPSWGTVHNSLVKFEDQSHPCEAADMSSTGATLRFKFLVKLPGHFSLLLTPNGSVRRECNVVWNSDFEVGVTFV